MALDQQIEALLEQMKNAPDPVTLGVDGYRQMVAAMGPPATSEAVDSVADAQVPGGDGDVAARVYRPETAEARPAVLVFFHGGGFVACGIDTHDELCRALCNRAGCVVVSVDYRLSPEAQYPAPLEDCYAATRWVAANGDRLQVDVDRLAVGGDSVGGYFAAAVTLMARDRDDGPAIAYQLLLAPALDSACNTPSHSEFSEGYFLTNSMMRWFWGHYLGANAGGQDALASPSRAAHLGGLPPAVVISAGFDPLRDEAEDYADRLQAAGVTVTRKRYDGMIHGFLSFPAVDVAQQARRDIGEWFVQQMHV